MAKGHRQDSKTRVQYAVRGACDDLDCGDPSGDNGLRRGTNSSARLDDESADTRHSSSTKTSSQTTSVASPQYQLSASVRVFDEGASNQNDLYTDTPDNVIGATCSEPTDSCQSIQPSESAFEDAGLKEEDTNPREIESISSQETVSARSKDVIKKGLTLNTDGKYPQNDSDVVCNIAALGKLKHEERFKRRDTCTDFCIHPSEKHDHHQHYARERDVFEHCCNKVGLVQCVQCGDLGTCFRIGACQCWTCDHVVTKCEARQHHLQMIFYNQGPKRDATHKFQIKLAYQDEDKDCVCYDLQKNGYDFPPAFENFREFPDEERLVYLVAFQKDLLRVCSDVVLLQPFSEDRITQLNVDLMERYPHAAEPLPFPHGPFKGENGCVPMLCPLAYGASGGLAVTFDESDKLIAVCMYRQGYPEQYYPSTGTKTSLTAEERERFPACRKVEMGLSLVDMQKNVYRI